MKHTLLFTTMANHRPVIYSNMESSGGRSSTDTSSRNLEEPRQFHVTQARDPIDTNYQNPRNAPQRTLSELLARSTQPIFSVSAMFRMNAGGGGCGACGH
jgi:hypothetical protein